MKWIVRALSALLASLVGHGEIATPDGVLFAALTTEIPVKWWQRVQQVLESGGTRLAMDQFLAFKSWVIQNKGELKMQFLPIANLTDDVNDLDGALRVYAVYVKKQNTATDSYYKLFDDATNSGTAADLKIVLPCFEASKESIAFFPDGIPLADGIVQTAQTTSNGSSDTTTGDGPNGFLLVAAA